MTSPAQRFKARLAAGERLILVNPDDVAAGLAQFIASNGADAIFIDCEHGAPSFLDVENMARATRLAGAVSIVRPDCASRPLMTRYLNRGIDGLMVPLVDSAEQCREIVEIVRYACPSDHGDKLVIAMIETVEAIANLPEMLEVDGVDVFFIGPGDLSQSMGYLPATRAGQPRAPALMETVERAIRAIVAGGRVAGTVANQDDAQAFAGLGAQLLYFHANEFIARGLRQVKNGLLPAGGGQ